MWLSWPKKILALICLAGSLAFTSCGNVEYIAEAASPWPRMAKIEEIVLTPQEVEMVKRWDKESGGLVSQLKRTLDAYKAEAETYERLRKAHNKKVIEGVAQSLHWSREQLQEALANEE